MQYGRRTTVGTDVSRWQQINTSHKAIKDANFIMSFAYSGVVSRYDARQSRINIGSGKAPANSLSA